MVTVSINATEKALLLQEKDKIAQIFLHTTVSIVCDRPYCRIVTNDRKNQQDHRMQRNYLKGTLGDAINTMLAAAGYNLKHWLNKVIFVFKSIYELLIVETLDFLILAQTRQMTFLTLGGFGKRGFWQV